MSDVLYVPAFDSNLLSISALGRKGLAVLFKGNKVEILRKNTCVATGVMRGRTYYLESSQVALMGIDDSCDMISWTIDTATIESANSSRDEPQQTKIWLWHARLGHASPRRLLSLDLQGFTPDTKDFQCTTCDFAKITRKVNHDPPQRESTLLRLVYTNVWGPYRIASLAGN